MRAKPEVAHTRIETPPHRDAHMAQPKRARYLSVCTSAGRICSEVSPRRPLTNRKACAVADGPNGSPTRSHNSLNRVMQRHVSNGASAGKGDHFSGNGGQRRRWRPMPVAIAYSKCGGRCFIDIFTPDGTHLMGLHFNDDSIAAKRNEGDAGVTIGWHGASAVLTRQCHDTISSSFHPRI